MSGVPGVQVEGRGQGARWAGGAGEECCEGRWPTGSDQGLGPWGAEGVLAEVEMRPSEVGGVSGGRGG